MAAEVQTGRDPAKKASRLWWLVHQWVGLKLSIFMSFILLTGTVAVFSNEIDWLVHPGMRVDPATVQGAPNWPAMAASVSAHRPDGTLTILDAPIDRGFAAYATVISAEGRRRLVYLHPSTGAVQGDYSSVTVQRVFRFMHRHLFLPTAIGVPIVSALSVLLFVTFVSSLIVYKRWWRGFFRPLRMRDARTALGDFHRLAGVWSLWFVALMALTGFWYLIESTVARAPPHPRATVEPAAIHAQDLSWALAESLAEATTAQPDLRIQRIVMPGERSGAFQFQGALSAILVRPRSNAVWTDASTAEVQLITDGRDLSVHQRISEMADPLHFGDFGGVWTKILWFLFGALMTALSISGAAIYSLRLIKAERETPTAARAARFAIKGMGWWKWPAITLVGVAAALWPISLGLL